MMKFPRHLWQCALALAFAAAAAAAQTPQDFQGLYGPPLSGSYARRPALEAEYGAPVSETYVVRPDISLTVNYSVGGEACRAEFKPYSSAPELFAPPDLVSAAEVEKIIEEIAPADGRGPRLNSFIVNSSCTSLAIDKHERVEVSRGLRAERCGGGVYSATVVWKGRGCARLPGGKDAARPGAVPRLYDCWGGRAAAGGKWL